MVCLRSGQSPPGTARPSVEQTGRKKSILEHNKAVLLLFMEDRDSKVLVHTDVTST